MMLGNPWIIYPCPYLIECLIVFAFLFLAGSFWAACIRWYIGYRIKGKSNA